MVVFKGGTALRTGKVSVSGNITCAVKGPRYLRRRTRLISCAVHACVLIGRRFSGFTRGIVVSICWSVPYTESGGRAQTTSRVG